MGAGKSEHRTLFDVVETMLTDLDPDRALQTLVTGMKRMEGVRAAAVFQLDEDSMSLRLCCQSGLGKAYAKWITVPIGKPAVGEAFLNRELVVIDDIDSVDHIDPRIYRYLHRQGVRAVAAAPLVARGKVIGVLAVYYGEPMPETRRDDDTIRVCANLAALAIDNARLFREKAQTVQELQLLYGQLSEQSALLRRANTVHEWLLQAVLDHGGLDYVTNTLGKLAQNTIVVEDSHLDTLYVSVTEPGDRRIGSDATDVNLGLAKFAGYPQVREHLMRLRETRRPIFLPSIPEIGLRIPRITAPILVGGTLLGFVSILARHHELGAFDFALAEQGAVAMALEMMKRKVAFETEQRIRGDFLHNILAGQLKNLDEASVVIAGTRFNLRALRRVVIIRPDKPTAAQQLQTQRDDLAPLLSRLYSVVDRLTMGTYPETIIVTEEEGIVMLLGSNSRLPDQAVRELAERIVSEVAARLEPLTVSAGIGGACEHPRDLRRSFVEAGNALKVSAVLSKRNSVILFSELGVSGILLQQISADELREFMRKYIGPLIAYEQTHERGLIETLSAYVRNDFRLENTARDLFVHPNTVKYRLKRIEELCHLDLQRSEDLMNMQVALRLHELMS